MAFFKDLEGREWTIEFNLWTTKRVKDGTGIDLTVVADGAKVIALIEETQTAAEVLWYLCKPQIEHRKLNQEEFFKALNGDVVADGVRAVWSAAEDFFPQERRSAFLALVDAQKRAETAKQKGLERLVARIAEPGTVENLVEKDIDEILRQLEGQLTSLGESSPTNSEGSSA